MGKVKKACAVVLMAGVAIAAAGAEVVPTADHPAPNALKPLGKRRFYVSSEYFLRNWALVGLWPFDRTAFPTEQCAGHSAVPLVKDEGKLVPRIGQEVDGRKWLIYQGTAQQDAHYADLTAFYKGMPRHTVCYAAADVWCDDEMKGVTLCFGCADSCRIYLNGKLIHVYDKARRAADPDTDRIKGLTLNKGWNLLLCRIGNVMHGAGLYARFADEKDFPIKVECPKLEAKEHYTPPPTQEAKGKQAAAIDLKGEWKICADPKAEGAKAKWFAEGYGDADWKGIKVPGLWEDTLNLNVKGDLGYYVFVATWATDRGCYNGIAWYRRKVAVPDDWRGKRIYLELGSVGDYDWTYVNGTLIGVTDYADSQLKWREAKRRYLVSEEAIHFGKDNTIAVQVFNVDGGGGILGPEVRLVAEVPADAGK